MPLSDTAIRNAKPTEKPYKMPDERGMYLFVHPNGGKYFRFDYRFAGKRKTLALGVYPDTSLKQARDKRDTAKKQIADGIDPSITRKIEKAGSIENTFKAVAEEFLEANSGRWSASHKRHIKECFERDVYPWLGSRPLKDLSAVEVFDHAQKNNGAWSLRNGSTNKAVYRAGYPVRDSYRQSRARRNAGFKRSLAFTSTRPFSSHYRAKAIRPTVKGY